MSMPPLPSFIVIVVIIGSILSSNIAVASAAATKETSEKVKVNVYNGRTECAGLNKIQAGNLVALHYTATIDESSETGGGGRKLDSSRDKGFAQQVSVREGKVITGLYLGLIGLCKGAEATLVIPPHLAYGADGHGPTVPGGATIKYDVEILDVKPEQEQSPPAPNEFEKIDANKDGQLSKEEAREYFATKDQPVDLDGLWKGEDKDGDGLISWQEFSGSKGDRPPHRQADNDRRPPPPKVEPAAAAAAAFEEMDANHDGKISRAELGASFAELGQVLTDEFWEASDGDMDGFVSWAEFIGSEDDGAPPSVQKKDEL